MKKLLLLFVVTCWSALFTFGQLTYTGKITNSADDVEEGGANAETPGAIYFDSSDLELVNDGGDDQTVGLRFTNVSIPMGAKIMSAYIQFTVDEVSDEATNLVIKAEDIDNSPAFAAVAYDVSSRVKTVDSVKWENIPAWESAGDATAAQMTPDVSSLVQAVVNRAGWEKGNALSFVITGLGKRVAESFDGSAEDAPTLIIEYYLTKNVEVAIATSLDDAEENGPHSPYGPGSLYTNSSDLELVEDGVSVQTVGLRFVDIDVPQGVIVESANIQFTADKDESEADSTSLWIKLEDIAMSPAFNEDAIFQMVSRTVLADSVLWEDIPAWEEQYAAGADQRTPELNAVVQQIIDKAEWLKGNAMSFIINGIGERSATSFDGDPEKAPRLNIRYLTDKVSPVLVMPIEDQVVDAGWDFNLYVGDNFADEDSELVYTATLSGGRPLPSWLTFENGTFSGMSYKVVTLPIFVKANGDGEIVEDQFMLRYVPAQKPFLTQLGSIQLGTFDEGAAEISAFDASSDRLFVTNAEKSTIDIIDMSDPTALAKVDSIDITAYGAGVNSVAAYNGLIVAAIEAEVKQENGKVVAFDSNGDELWQVTAGALPDMVTFNEDGTKVIVANEGEPNGDYSVDPEGTVTIINVADQAVSTADFTAFNGQEAALALEGIRVFGPNATVAMDIEPEYITVKGDSAFVTCQENNAVAVIKISTAEVVALNGLGYKDHSIAMNGIDASNKADFIDIRPWPVMGIYQPDAIASYVVDGTTYYVTANEGDAREYDTYEEEINIDDIVLDPTVFSNIDMLMDNKNLGKLKLTNAMPDTNENGEYKTLFSYGARSFSIWNAETGDLVFDSGDEIEQITAAFLPENFNCADDDTDAKDRSDNKGPEPEAITIGKIAGKSYAFIGLERVGGVMVYDITNPSMPKFVEYTNNRDFSTDPEDDYMVHGDNGPEGIVFIEAAQSPNGKDLIVVSNEVSGTVTTYSVGDAPQPFTLAIFHNNDGESDLLGDSIMVNGNKVLGSSIAQFKTVLDNERTRANNLGYASIMLSSGDNFLAGKEFNASQALGKYYDAIALDTLNYDAICLGNHDFDFGPNILADFINEFETNKAPYLSANLSFENEPRLDSLASAERILPFTVVEKMGEQIGVIGLTTPTIDVISSPGNTTISENLIDTIQTYVDSLTAMNVNKIILISHLQSIGQDTALARQIEGIDIMIAGGGDELLANDETLGAPYHHDAWGSYPLEVEDKNGDAVYIVTTPGNYRYLGNLVADFDADGKVTRIHNGVDPILVAGVAENQDLKTNVIEPINNYIQDLVNNVIAESEVAIELRKSEIRTRETNGGNLVADALLWQATETADEYSVSTPHVAIQNGGGLRIDAIIPEGDFTEVLTYDICAFDNKVSVIESVTPADFLAIMEHALGDVQNVGGRFSQIAGFSVVYNPMAEPGSRIAHIELDNGAVIVEDGMVKEDAQNINVTTINYLAGGGDGYPYADLGYEYVQMGATYQQALANYITAENGLDSLITAEDYPLGGEGRIVEDIVIPVVEVPFYETYEAGVDAWTIYNVLGDEEWSYETQYGVGGSSMMKISGYNGGAQDNEDWLISPAIGVLDVNTINVAFQSATKYDGPEMAVLYSFDYAGYGDPTMSTWDIVPGVQVAQDNSDYTWEESGIGSIANSSNPQVFVAFVYTSNPVDGAAIWEVDSVVVDGEIYIPVFEAPFAESFDSVANNEDIVLEGWYNLTEEGSSKWIGKEYNDNKYAQFSSYGSGEANQVILVTPAIDMTNAANMELSFDVNIGYYTHDALSVYVLNSEGNEVDVTSNFTIPQEPTSGYGTFATAGSMDLADYVNDTIRVAFVYNGDANNSQTTTIQIDNVSIEEKIELYEVTFAVVDAYDNVLDSAMVMFNDTVVYTDAAGMAVFANILPGEMSYLVSNFPYIEVYDSVDVMSDTTITVTMQEPTMVMLPFNQDFESVEAYESIQLEGWYNMSIEGDRKWEGREFNENKYAQFSSYNSDTANVAALVTPGIDLSDISNAEFSFDVNIGYYTHDALLVLIATTSGDEVDVTDNFTIPQEPTDGYGTFATAGIMDISEFAGDTIYIAFIYAGDDNEGLTTTIQIDNVKLEEKVVVEYFDITFSVMGEDDDVIADASVEFNGETKTTDASGMVVFEDVEEASGVAYTVTKTDYETVSATVDVDEDKTVDVTMIFVSTPETLASQFSVYPNPATASVNVTLPTNFTGSVSLLDMSGRTVYMKEVNAATLKIDLGSFETGIYFIQVANAEEKVLERLMINK